MASKDILIVSSSYDNATWGPVAAKLEGLGHQPLIFEADRVALGDTSFDIKIDKQGLSINYEGLSIDPESIAAAWYRRVNFISNNSSESTRQMSIDVERKALLSTVWERIPDERWLNSPDRMIHASRKISQLILAHEIGFATPTTLVANQWDVVSRELPEEIIFKPSYPLLYGGDEILSVFSTLYRNDKNALPTSANPYPGIWQPLVPKTREWRITIVGDESFDASIYTSADAKDDWRKHQNIDGRVRFESEAFPDDIKLLCFEYLARLGLKYGAFDFIENDSQGIVFLECNPNGQYGWIEQGLGYPISSAIAVELSKIARQV